MILVHAGGNKQEPTAIILYTVNNRIESRLKIEYLLIFTWHDNITKD